MLYSIWKKGIYKTRSALFNRNKSTHYWITEGDHHIKEGDLTRAYRCYEKALKINPSCAIAWKRRGTVLGMNGMYLDAIRSFEKAIAIDYKDDDAWRQKGFNYFRLRLYDDALRSFEKALLLKGDHPFGWYLRGLTLEALGRPEYIDSYARADLLIADVIKTLNE